MLRQTIGFVAIIRSSSVCQHPGLRSIDSVGARFTANMALLTAVNAFRLGRRVLSPVMLSTLFPCYPCAAFIH